MMVLKIIAGLAILEAANPKGPGGYHARAEHDAIYAGSLDWPLSDENRKSLEGYGWVADEDADGWRADL